MKSFTTRVAVLFAALATATTAIVLTVGGWLLSHQAVHGLDLLNTAEFAELRTRLGSDPHGLSAPDVDRMIRAHAEVDASMFFFQVESETGNILFRSANLGQLMLPGAVLDDQGSTNELRGVGKIRLGIFPLGELRVLIASPLEPALQLMGSYAKTSALLLVGVAIATLGIGWTFSSLVLRPVRAIRTTAGRIRGDNLSERIPVPPGHDELVALVTLLNQMFDRLETSFSEVKRFTADASHELKTPLALARLSAEKLRTRIRQDPEAEELVGTVMEDLERLRQIVDSLLFLAKADSGGFAPAFAEIDTRQFVQDFAADALVMSEDRGVAFKVVRADAGRTRGETTLLRQLLLNLVSNAVRVLPAGGQLTIESEIDSESWRIVVTDEGPGLAPEQLERVFERFVRIPQDSAGPGRESGNGLGLAICRSIARLHGGEIHAENRQDRTGLRVIITIPLAT